MSNTTIKAEIRRNGGKPWLGKYLRTARMLILAWVSVIALPGVAQAALWESNGCRSLRGASIQLIPAVNFTLGTLPPAGTEIYRTQTYVISYECSYYDEYDRPYVPAQSPQLQALGDFTTLNLALSKAGLELQIIVNGDEDHPWKPNVLPAFGNTSEFRPIGSSYSGSSGPRSLTLIAKLVVKNPDTIPARYPVPAGIIFRIMPGYGAWAYQQVNISNTATRMQFVPQCIGDVSVENLVQFNNVFTTGSLGRTVSQQHPFNVTARVNPACSIGSLTFPTKPDNEWTRFTMLLSAQFVLQGPGRIDSDGTSIVLKNEDGEENGLKMQILDPNNANQPVQILSTLAPPLREDVGNFGQLVGHNPAAMVHTYMASLASDAGKELKLGKYSTQVLVRVSYY